MSIPVALSDLAAAVRDRGRSAYVLTVSERGTPHVVHAEVIVDGGSLIAVVGMQTADNAQQRPVVSLLYPSRGPIDHSLIIDTVATLDITTAGARLILEPTRAVLHRPVSPVDPTIAWCRSARATAAGGVGGDEGLGVAGTNSLRRQLRGRCE